MGGGSMKSNPTRSRKRVEATAAEDSQSTGPSLVRGKDGSAFARWKKPNSSSSEPNAKRAKSNKAKKRKDPNAPKRPLTAFFLFMSDFRKTYKEANPDSKGSKMVAKEGGEKWKSMADEEKKPYIDKADELKAEFKTSLENDNAEEIDVLDFAAFPEPEYDMPIFCANFFTSANVNIVVLDLNPLHDVISERDYKDKYYKGLIPLGVKYSELLPWGGKLTSESLKFFSPIVIWSRFTSSPYNYDVLYSAFMDYYKDEGSETEGEGGEAEEGKAEDGEVKEGKAEDVEAEILLEKEAPEKEKEEVSDEDY